MPLYLYYDMDAIISCEYLKYFINSNKLKLNWIAERQLTLQRGVPYLLTVKSTYAFATGVSLVIVYIYF